MQLALIVTLVLHGLSGVFWAGSTFVLARGVDAAQALRMPQRGASAVALVTGIVLMALTHRDSFGAHEAVLLAGIVAALAAGAVQSMMASRGVVAHRIAAVLLMLTVACMLASKYL